jgi:7,8-didemethyl-8-hydroxy-5-deazariboflavin synthase CofG subunit
MNFDTHPKSIVTYSPSWTLIPTHWCRNTCGYCVFVQRTGAASQLLSPANARTEIVRAVKAGATELLMMSGEAVEDSREIRASLRQFGFTSYLDYLLDTARSALARGILPHVNIGNLCADELRALRQVAPSLGMMLESADESLRVKAAHRRARDKEFSRRVTTLEAAGNARVPFTTGLLIGIGESEGSRIETLNVIADVQRRFGHVQEVIVQPFTPHAGTSMADAPTPLFEEVRDAVLLAREILPQEVSVQIPPNIATRFVELIEAGANDLGGISPDGDRINPDERWLAPRIYREALAARGFTLRARLAVHESWDTNEWLSAETFEAVRGVRQSSSQFSDWQDSDKPVIARRQHQAQGEAVSRTLGQT